MGETYKHPEWKQLFEIIGQRILSTPHKRIYLYEELQKIAGIDIRTPRGRQQFERFNRECRSVLGVHWENVRNEGYRIVEASEHANCSMSRVKKAGKQMKKGKHIIDSTDLAQLSDRQKSMNLMMRSCFNVFVEQMKEHSKALKKIACAIESPKLLDQKTVDATLELFKPKENSKH